MLYLRWFSGFFILLLLISLFFFIGGNLINILLGISLFIIVLDYVKERLDYINYYKI